MISSEQTVELQVALEPIYVKLTGPRAHEPWRQPLCIDWSWEARKIAKVVLDIQNPNHLQTIECIPERETKYRFDLPYRHRYLIDVRNPADPTAIDGTYLQMARRQPKGAFDHILVSPLSQLENTLDTAGVNPELAFIWQPFVQGPANHYRTTSRY